jgi:hypothetical protein
VKFVVAALALAACSTLHDPTCLPRGKVLRTGGKPDGALVGAICSTEKLERIMR